MLECRYLKHDWNPMMKGVLPPDGMDVWITIELPNAKRAVRRRDSRFMLGSIKTVGAISKIRSSLGGQ